MSAASASGERGSQDQDQEKKPATNQGSSHINIKVNGVQEKIEARFRIKRNVQLRTLMNLYCDHYSQDFNSIAFLYEGNLVSAYQTPDELKMEDEDEIDAMSHQMGGGF
ncbi:small ubiquitin-related modifier 1-like [Lotus japonicus]|uniref:Ubiquitin-like domain-containing protein n=1 Tax=Lotus japonicus TaxID=34305 RepID=I3SW62_LOTJA|nr:small ubiquitin-related modifier 1-like [Lotus japonicus]XP_057437083.1 small ubiquitin-related modifier 1-like [Lotus japonicus]XP_057437084.1 small ubiquitin-related modifier 1-like [Lotus japonicus]AFK44504.1 unknown [Lotus japonicus]